MLSGAELMSSHPSNTRTPQLNNSTTGWSRRVYRSVFIAAAAYNIGFGVWTVLVPQAFFEIFRLAPPRYPSIWSCLGLVVGLFGVAYAYAATHLDRARPFIAIGLAGKVLGPVGWFFAVGSAELPVRTFPLIVFNDVLWWFPFAFFLLEGTRIGRFLERQCALLCALIHAAAALATVFFVRGLSYRGEDPDRWRMVWLLWMMAAVSLIGFFAWWGSHLPYRRAALGALAIASIGLLCDFAGESLMIGWIPPAGNFLGRVTTLLTAGAANGFYTIAGIILTLATPIREPWLRVWTWLVWASGLVLSICAVLDMSRGIMVSSAMLMTLFIPWVMMFSRKLA